MQDELRSPPKSAREPLSEDAQAFVDIWGGKIGVQLAHGNRAAAHELVDKAMSVREAVNAPPILSTPLAEMGFDVMTCNALERHADILTVGDLLESDIATLLSLPNVGTNRILALISTLAAQPVKRVIELEKQLAK